MPRKNFKRTNVESARKAKKRAPSKGKSHTSKTVKIKKVRRIFKTIPGVTENQKGMN